MQNKHVKLTQIFNQLSERKKKIKKKKSEFILANIIGKPIF